MTATPDDQQIRDKEQERENALRAKIAREATIYSTIFDQVRLRLEPFTKWVEHFEDPSGRLVVVPNGATPQPSLRVVKDPPLLSGSDLKDVATSIYINLSRGISWR